MAGFFRYVSVQMVIADNGGAPFPPYRSQLFPSNFPWFSNGFTGVPLSRSQFFPNGYGYGYTGCVPIRPQFYTQVWQEEEDSEEEVEVDVEEVKGDSENKALHKCCKFLADWFHRFYDNLSHFKQFFVDWFHQFYENFDFKQFLSNSKHYRERSTVFLEHLAEFMASLNRIMEELEEWNDMDANKAGDSYHCYYYYNKGIPLSSRPECCPCIEFQRGAPLRHPIGYTGACCRYCKLCNPPRAEANNRTEEAASGDSYHCYYYYYYYYHHDSYSSLFPGRPPSECPCIKYRIDVSMEYPIYRARLEEVVQKCCECCKLCNIPGRGHSTI